MAKRQPTPLPGMGVDAAGGAVIDPTANVLSLVEAANRRQDDLRLANNARLDAEVRCIREIAALRSEHSREMRDAETRRLDAIRQVDVLAVSTAAERALAAIQVLDTTTKSNAENIRNTLTTTAAAIAAQTANTVSAITERLAALERSSYEGKGKQALADPQLVELLAEVKRLRESRATTTGHQAGGDATWKLIAFGAGLILTMLTILSVGLVLMRTMRVA